MSLKEIDQLLEQTITTLVGDGDIQVSFKTPMKPGFTPDSGISSINVYLYELHEDMERRSTCRVINRSDNPKNLASGPPRQTDPPRYLKLSYMITAWFSDPPVAHEWLGALFTAFAQRPPQYLENGDQIIIDVGLPPVQDRILTELWSTFHNPLMPFLNLTVTVPMTVAVTEHVHYYYVKDRESVLIGADSRDHAPGTGPRPS
ncbi:Pvc16 family protein [Streptomyces luteireticuli]|uniref:Pvc16 family protein n=1 Tax=Streptomyces luteireticuli TaxID=173858 RepID=UPI0035567C5D